MGGYVCLTCIDNELSTLRGQLEAANAEAFKETKRANANAVASNEWMYKFEQAESRISAMREALTKRQKFLHNAQCHEWLDYEKCDHKECVEAKKLAEER